VNPTPSIIYMGTPDFAVPSFHALHQSPFDVKLVVTQPDRPKGRGRRLSPPPVKQVAQEFGYNVLQPSNVRDPEFMDALQAFRPDFLVVVAFGQILPAAVLAVPHHGAINVHASLLPRYRGPAPIQWAIMRGETQTGVTTMLMDTGVDTGDMLLSGSTPIRSDDTSATLHDRLARLGADLLVETIHGVWEGTLFPRAQNHAQATYAPLLKKDNGRIDWQRSAHAIDYQIRAMTPWPGAFCFFENKRYKIHRASPIDGISISPPGTVVPGFPDELRIATGDGVLCILEIQGESGKRIPIKQFMMGSTIALGAQFD
jgi:methionyl-tRNA formyltransferase